MDLFQACRPRSDCYYAKLVIKFSISNRYPQTSVNNELADTSRAKYPKTKLCSWTSGKVENNLYSGNQDQKLGLSVEINWGQYANKFWVKLS